MSVSDPWRRTDAASRSPDRAAADHPLTELADRLATARRSGEPAPEELERLVAMLARSDIDPGDRLTRALEGLARWSDDRGAPPPAREPRPAAPDDRAPREPAPSRGPVSDELEQRLAEFARSLSGGKPERGAAPQSAPREEPRHRSEPGSRPQHRPEPQAAAETASERRPSSDQQHAAQPNLAQANPAQANPAQPNPARPIVAPPISSLRAALAEISARQKALDAEGDAHGRSSPLGPEPEPRLSPRPASPVHAPSFYSVEPAAPWPAPASAQPAPAVARELRAEIDRLGLFVNDLPTRPEIDRLTREMATLAERLSEDRPARLDRESLTAIDALVAEVDRMRSDAPSPQTIATFAEELHAISARLDVIGPRNSTAIDALARRIEDVRGELDQFPRIASVDSVASEIQTLIQRIDSHERAAAPTREAVVGLAGRVQALDGQIAAIAEATAGRDDALDRISATIRSELDSLPRADAVTDLGRQIDALTEGLKSRSAIGPALKAVEGLAVKVDALDWRLAEKVDALDGRLAAMAADRPDPADGLAQTQAFDDLSRRIEQLAKSFAERRDTQTEISVASLTARIEGLGERFETMTSATAAHGAAFDRVEDSVRAVAEQLLAARSPSAAGSRALETEVVRLVEGLDRNGDRVEDLHAAFSGLASRIERSCADLGAHVTQSAVSAAREVLDAETSGGRLEGEFAGALKDLRSSSAQSERRAAEALDAVRSTLERLLDRMENQSFEQPIEAPAEPFRTAAFGRSPEPMTDATEIARAAARRALEEIDDDPSPARRFPPADGASAFRPAYGDDAPDHPIEPGAVFQRHDADASQPTPQSAASFIAAARRAGLKSAAEPSPEPSVKTTPAKRPALFSGALAALKARKRPLLLGIAAALIVFAALYVASGMTGEPEDAPPPPAPVSQAAPAAEPQSGAHDAAPSPADRQASGETDRRTESAAGTASADRGREPVRTAAEAMPDAQEETAPQRAAAAPLQNAAPAASAASSATTAAPVPSVASPGATAPSAGFRPDRKEVQPATTGSIGRSPNDLPTEIGGPTLRARALSGDASAQLEVADRLLDGRNVEADPAAALRWLEKAASQGLAPAQHRLGSLYEKGRGVPRDVAQARRWYEQAAASGNVRAMHNLGVVHAEGGLGRPDFAAAAVWFRMAAERGLVDSDYNLAVLYARGLGGKRDLVEAYKWFALAAGQGDPDAAIKRDEVGKALGASLGVAKAAVAGFQPKPTDPAANEPQVPPGGWDRVAAKSGPADARLR